VRVWKKGRLRSVAKGKGATKGEPKAQRGIKTLKIRRGKKDEGKKERVVATNRTCRPRPSKKVNEKTQTLSPP